MNSGLQQQVNTPSPLQHQSMDYSIMLQRTERGQKVQMQLQTEGRQRVVSVQQCQSWDTQEGHGSLHEHWLVTAEGHRAAPSPGTQTTRRGGITHSVRLHKQLHHGCAHTRSYTDTAGWTNQSEQGCPFKYAEVTETVKLQKDYNLGFIHTSLSCRS